jgi:molybdopterin molybdotransferase
MQGDLLPLPAPLRLPLLSAVRHKPGRLEFLRARLERDGDMLGVRVLDNQASGALTSLAWSDALALLPTDVAELQIGDAIEVLRWADF